MNVAVFLKTLRDELLTIVSGAISLILFQFLFVAAMAKLAPEAVQFWRRFAFLKQMFQAMFHIDLDAQVSMDVLVAVGMTHPMLLTLCCGCVVASCTRVISGEIAGGTADLLLGLPIPRWKIFVSVTLAWVITTCLLCVSVWFGVAACSLVGETPTPSSLGGFAIAAFNLLLLLLAIGGFAMCISTFCNRRSIAVGICVGALLVSYLIGFLEVFFPFVGYVRWAGLLCYYQPTTILGDGELTWPVIAGYLGTAVGLWGIGLWRFQTRDVQGG